MAAAVVAVEAAAAGGTRPVAAVVGIQGQTLPPMLPQLDLLIDAARPLVREIILSRPDFSAGAVAAAILGRSGRIYTGVCVHVSCGIGFCAEHAAVAEMLKAGETEIEAIVAVSKEGVLSPCGRCRELIVQVDRKNLDALVALPGNQAKRLRELLPDHWLGY